MKVFSLSLFQVVRIVWLTDKGGGVDLQRSLYDSFLFAC